MRHDQNTYQEPSRPFRIIASSFAAALFALAVAGCGLTESQRAGIAGFGSATKQFGEVTAKQLPAYRDDIVHMNTVAWVLNSKGNKLSEKKPNGDPADAAYYRSQVAFDDGLTPEQIQVRIEAINVLTTYGSLLQTFASSSQAEQLQASADKFVASVEALPNSPLSQEKVEGLGKIVQIGGNIWIEWKKRKTIEQVVPIGSALIRNICDRLKTDFDPQLKGIAALLDGAEDNLEVQAKDWLRRPPGPSLSDRLLQLEAFRTATMTYADLRFTSKQALGAIEALRTANDNLDQAVREGKVSIEDIKAYQKTVQQLVSAIQSVAG